MHPNLHLEQLPWVCMAFFIPSSMFWVAGGFSSYNTMGEHNHSDRYRGPQPMTLPYLTLPYLTSPYLTLPYLTLPYLTLPYLTLPYLTLPYLTLPHLTLPYLTLP